jgi:hypothetical protein
MHKGERLDTCNIMTRMFRYSIIGLASVIALQMVPSNKLTINDILMITSIIVIIYFLLDTPIFKKETYTNV